MDELRSNLAQIIRNRRQELDISQEELAERIGKTPGFVGQLERQESSPGLETLNDLIHTLGIDANEIFSNHEIDEVEFGELRSIMLQLDDRSRHLLIEIARLLLKDK